MILSERQGVATWRPVPALNARSDAAGFMAVPMGTPGPKAFVGEAAGRPSLKVADPVRVEHEPPAAVTGSAHELSADATALQPPDEAAEAPAAVPLPEPAVDLEVLRAEAFREGYAAGESRVRAEMAAGHAEAVALLRSVTESLRASLGDTQQLHAPLKRLALHIAEVLVRGELQVSGQVIDRLVRHSIEALAEPDDRIVVRLNPEDADRLQAMGEAVTAGLQIERDAQLPAGSLRLQSRETVVEDLLEHRLEVVAQRLLGETQAWRSQSPLLNPRTAEPAFAASPGRSRWPGRVVDTVDAEPLPAERADEPGHEG
jgi:flagellar biosynthesis/type III secretory pathway protein FliH